MSGAKESFSDDTSWKEDYNAADIHDFTSVPIGLMGRKGFVEARLDKLGLREDELHFLLSSKRLRWNRRH